LEPILQKRTRSILDELDSLLTHRDKQNLVESRANHVIQGAINLVNYIRENSQDAAKFTRGVRKMRDED